MSIQDAVILSELQRASFGTAPVAIVASLPLLERVVSYHLAAMSGDAKLADFGDSHSKSGFAVATLEAALLRRIARDDASLPLSMAPCQARQFNAAVYGSFGIYVEPWHISPHLAPLSSQLASLAANCTADVPAEPLGKTKVAVFLNGQSATLRVPLVSRTAHEPLCFDHLCVDTELPSIADNIPYSSLALQARPSDWIKSEIDFGTIIWSAWGCRLLSEFGYGTIATALPNDPSDTRRLEFLDNGPAGARPRR